jgi:L-alanine-DL-glutamate epimerase-like enolase superfamily enzyme
MKIVASHSFLLRVPIESKIADSMQAVTCLEFVGLTIETDAGITGTGYTITVGHGGSVIREVIDSLFRADLIGRDPHNVREIWQQLYFGKSHWIGRAGATTMAQAAVDIALWDIKAKAANLPLWRLLGGARAAPIPAYNTHAGWLNYSIDQLEEEALSLIDAGYTALKMKVGLAESRADYERVKAVRQAIGDDCLLMVDANQRWDSVQASSTVHMLEEFNLTWVEEPLHPDDVPAHRTLKERTSIPIALGEHLYTTHAFRDFLAAGAVDFVQVDVCRIGGITPWLDVAALAHANGVRVSPHAGDLMQVHQHLVRAIPNSWRLEVIPLWKEGPFRHQIRIERGTCLTPMEPGASSDFTPAAMEKYRVG